MRSPMLDNHHNELRPALECLKALFSLTHWETLVVRLFLGFKEAQRRSSNAHASGLKRPRLASYGINYQQDSLACSALILSCGRT